MIIGGKYFLECIMVLLIVQDWSETSRKQTKWGVFFLWSTYPDESYPSLASLCLPSKFQCQYIAIKYLDRKHWKKKNNTTVCVPTIAIWLPVLLLPTDQSRESHKDESIAGNEGWVWCRHIINISYCIWTPVLVLHYWAVPVRSELNGLKRCLAQWPTQAKPL